MGCGNLFGGAYYRTVLGGRDVSLSIWSHLGQKGYAACCDASASSVDTISSESSPEKPFL